MLSRCIKKGILGPVHSISCVRFLPYFILNFHDWVAEQIEKGDFVHFAVLMLSVPWPGELMCVCLFGIPLGVPRGMCVCVCVCVCVCCVCLCVFVFVLIHVRIFRHSHFGTFFPRGAGAALLC